MLIPKFSSYLAMPEILNVRLIYPKKSRLVLPFLLILIPFMAGTMNNKVVQMMARSFIGLGFLAVRMNFRGVGKSEGAHDFGNGETEDMENVLEHMQRKYPNLPVVLGGFSFGTYVQSRLQQQMVLKGQSA